MHARVGHTSGANSVGRRTVPCGTTTSTSGLDTPRATAIMNPRRICVREKKARREAGEGRKRWPMAAATYYSRDADYTQRACSAGSHTPLQRVTPRALGRQVKRKKKFNESLNHGARLGRKEAAAGTAVETSCMPYSIARESGSRVDDSN